LCQIRNEFDTNVFSVINTTRAFLPHFKKNKKGTFITVASMFGRITLPFFSYYAATKWAVEGFTESLWYELNQHNIRVKIIEPGTIKTDFFGRSIDIAKNIKESFNAKYSQRIFDELQEKAQTGEPAERAADSIYKAATSPDWQLRYVVDRTAKLLLAVRSLTPVEVFLRLVKKSV
jgi:short-subunit dehydrogenase